MYPSHGLPLSFPFLVSSRRRRRLSSSAEVPTEKNAVTRALERDRIGTGAGASYMSTICQPYHNRIVTHDVCLIYVYQQLHLFHHLIDGDALMEYQYFYGVQVEKRYRKFFFLYQSLRVTVSFSSRIH